MKKLLVATSLLVLTTAAFAASDECRDAINRVSDKSFSYGAIMAQSKKTINEAGETVVSEEVVKTALELLEVEALAKAKCL